MTLVHRFMLLYANISLLHMNPILGMVKMINSDVSKIVGKGDVHVVTNAGYKACRSLYVTLRLWLGGRNVVVCARLR